MPNGSRIATWWQHERQRDVTKLECGLLGALMAALAMLFLVGTQVVLG